MEAAVNRVSSAPDRILAKRRKRGLIVTRHPFGCTLRVNRRWQTANKRKGTLSALPGRVASRKHQLSISTMCDPLNCSKMLTIPPRSG